MFKCRYCSTDYDKDSKLYISYRKNLCRTCYNSHQRKLMNKRINKDTKSYIYYSIQQLKHRNKEVDITEEYILKMFETQEGKCSKTGIELVLGNDSGNKRDYRTLSIDRIDNNKGYTKDNIQLVCFGYNMLKNVWTDEIAYLIAKGLVENS